jgi:hypothetical protein
MRGLMRNGTEPRGVKAEGSPIKGPPMVSYEKVLDMREVVSLSHDAPLLRTLGFCSASLFL